MQVPTMKPHCLPGNFDTRDQCRNCGCGHERRRFKRRDCCGKCFYLFEYLKVVERWDPCRPETLKNVGALRRSVGGEPVDTLRRMSQADFLILKSSYIRQIKAALHHLKIRETKRRGEARVDGASVEEKLKNILRAVQLRDTYERVAPRFNGLASALDTTFSPAQCRFLYNLLDDVEEHTYGNVAESGQALEAVHQYRQDEPVSIAGEGGPADPPRRPPAPEAMAAGAAAHDLWLVDFKHRMQLAGGYAHPLIVVDAYSGAVALTAVCAGNGPENAKAHLERAFRRHGVPRRAITRVTGPRAAYTPLDVWLLEQDIAIDHQSRLHAQVKDAHDRFAARLRAEVLDRRYDDGAAAEQALTQWAAQHNAARRTCLPGSAADHPASERPYSGQVVPFEYEPHDMVRRVQERGRISLFGQIVRVPKAFRGKDVALRPTPEEGVIGVHFRMQRIATVKVRSMIRPASIHEDALLREATPQIRHASFAGSLERSFP
jgi:hypothetical protein